MRARKDAAGIVRIECQRPYTSARYLHVFRIKQLPSIACILRREDAAVALNRARNEHLIRVIRIDKDARVIPEWQPAPPSCPRPAPVAAQIERIDRPDVHVVRPFWVAGDRTDRDTL